MKKMLLLTVCTILSGACLQAESLVKMYTYALSGPLNSNPNFLPWATNQVYEAYQHGAPSNTLGVQLQSSLITQPIPARDQSNLWFMIRIVSRFSWFKFRPDRLEFNEWSSDPAHTLNQKAAYTNETYVFAPQVLGVVWDPATGIPGIADILVTSGPLSETPVHEFIFIGQASTYFTYTNETSRAQREGYVASFPDFWATGTWELKDLDGHLLGMSQKTLQTKGFPLKPRLSISLASGTSYFGANLETNRTVTLQSTRSLNEPIRWEDEATLNAGDGVIARIPGFAGVQHLFMRGVLQ